MNKCDTISIRELSNKLIDYRGKTPKKADSGVRLITAKVVKNGGIQDDRAEYIADDYFDVWMTRGLVEDGDVVLTTEAPLGEVAIVDNGKYALGQRIILVRTDKDVMLSKFLYFSLQSDYAQEELLKRATGTTVLGIKQQELLNVLVPYFPLDEQKKITAVLWTYKELIDNNNRRIAILEEMAQRLYREWFVHFRFPGHENAEMVESELGVIPEGWEVHSPKEMAAHYIGGGWGKENHSDALEPAFVIRGTDIPNAQKNNVTNCPLRYHTKSNAKDRCLSNGDIVIEVSGGSKGQPVGRSLLITNELLDSFNGQQVICASFCKLYRCNPTLISPYYLYLWLIEIYVNGEIEKYQSQSTGIINFKFEYFLNSKIVLVPTTDVQNAFNKQVVLIFKQISLLGRKNTALRKTRDLLLPRLISGDIDVSKIDIPVEDVSQ